METVSLLSVLSVVTLVAVLAIGVTMLIRVRNSQKKRHETPGGIAGPSSE